MKFSVVISRYHREIAEGMLWACQDFLQSHGQSLSSDDIVEAPGAFEIPLIAQTIAQSGRYQGVICLGCVIKGETAHFEYISNAVSQALMHATLNTGVPISFGILTTYTEEQAKDRSKKNGRSEDNKGYEAARSCYEAARTLQALKDQS